MNNGLSRRSVFDAIQINIAAIKVSSLPELLHIVRKGKTAV
ncbi:MAG: hypothetical protein ACOH2K_09585 [Burkholderiaceae bacterium]